MATRVDDQHGTEVIGKQVEGNKLTATGGRLNMTLKRSVLGRKTQGSPQTNWRNEEKQVFVEIGTGARKGIR